MLHRIVILLLTAIRRIWSGVSRERAGHRSTLCHEGGIYAHQSPLLLWRAKYSLQLRKTDMLRKGQEGHVRAERDILKSASLVSAPGGAEWIVRLFYSFQDRDHLYLVRQAIDMYLIDLISRYQVLEYMGGGDLLNLLIEQDVFEEDFTRFYIAEVRLSEHSPQDDTIIAIFRWFSLLKPAISSVSSIVTLNLMYVFSWNQSSRLSPNEAARISCSIPKATSNSVILD